VWNNTEWSRIVFLLYYSELYNKTKRSIGLLSRLEKVGSHVSKLIIKFVNIIIWDKVWYLVEIYLLFILCSLYTVVSLMTKKKEKKEDNRPTGLYADLLLQILSLWITSFFKVIFVNTIQEITAEALCIKSFKMIMNGFILFWILWDKYHLKCDICKNWCSPRKLFDTIFWPTVRDLNISIAYYMYIFYFTISV